MQLQYVRMCQKKQDKKTGAQILSRKKTRDRLSRQKGEDVMPKKGHRTSLRVEASFSIMNRSGNDCFPTRVEAISHSGLACYADGSNYVPMN